MAGPGGIAPTVFTLSPDSAVCSGLQPGGTITTTIQGTPGRLSLLVGGIRIPLTGARGFDPGQPVRVEILEAGPALQVRVFPNTQAAAEETSVSAHGFGAVSQSIPAPAKRPGTVSPGGTPAQAPPQPSPELVAVLRLLGALSLANHMAYLVPQHLPQSEDALRQLAGLFLFQGTTGADLETILNAIAEAAGTGAIPAALAAQAHDVLGGVMLWAGADIERALRHLARYGSRGLERKAAMATASGKLDALLDAAAKDVATFLLRLRAQTGLAGYLRRGGIERRFQEAVDRVINRLDAVQLQNLHSLDGPYLFLEAPVPWDGLFQRVHLHLFGDEAQQGQQFVSKNGATVVLDLATTRLGDMWIVLSLNADSCMCRFRVAKPETARAIEEEVAVLRAGLAAVGYPGSHVSVTVWDGDRLREAAGLMQRFRGFEVEA